LAKSKAEVLEMEKQKAATRQLGGLGRFVIPEDIRETLGWGTGTRLEVEISDITVKSITIREVSACCSLCRAESEDLKSVEKGYVCPKCLAKIESEA